MSIKIKTKRLVKDLVPYVRQRQFRLLDARLQAKEASLPAAALEHVSVLPSRAMMLEHLPKGGAVAEVGVAAGDFSALIFEVSRPQKLYLIDLWRSPHRTAYDDSGLEQVKGRFREPIATGQVVLDRGFSWEQLKRYDDAVFDWVYIDAAHDFDW